MSPTDAGKELREEAVKVIQSAQSMLDTASKLRSCPRGVVKLGLNSSSEFLRLGDLVAQLRISAPGISVEPVTLTSGEIVDLLAKGELDLGFVYGSPGHTRLNQIPLHKFNLVIVGEAEAGNRISGTWEELSKLSWIYSNGWCPFEQAVEDKLTSMGLPYKTGVLLKNDESKGELAKAGVGIVALEEGEALKLAAKGKITIWRPASLPCILHIAFRLGSMAQPQISRVIEIIRKVWDSPIN